MQGHTNKRTEEKDTGFLLTTGGNDRRGAEGMTEGNVCSGRSRTTTSQSSSRGPGPATTHAGPHDSAHVIPDIVNRESMLFPCRVTQIKGQKRKTLDSR